MTTQHAGIPDSFVEPIHYLFNVPCKSATNSAGEPTLRPAIFSSAAVTIFAIAGCVTPPLTAFPILLLMKSQTTPQANPEAFIVAYILAVGSVLMSLAFGIGLPIKAWRLSKKPPHIVATANGIELDYLDGFKISAHSLTGRFSIVQGTLRDTGARQEITRVTQLNAEHRISTADDPVFSTLVSSAWSGHQIKKFAHELAQIYGGQVHVIRPRHAPHRNEVTWYSNRLFSRKAPMPDPAASEQPIPPT